ncbi:hypothetical protein ABT294_13730 [Nonomuraea sp. NPDC000554]|uniref:hypothetical protein n=1 Tax=Nonomuraea sp. NPDC000554 TaxID=3154259 RepID=UPI00331BDB28
MGSYDDDTLPLQPPVRLPSEAELAAAVRTAPLAAEPLGDGGEIPADGADVLEAWFKRLGDEEGLLLEVVRRFLSPEPPEGDVPELLTGLGLVREAKPHALTPLGLWAGRRIIAETTGQHIPITGSLADADAATLLHGLRSYPEPERAEELAGWLSGRDPDEAAAAIAAVLPEVSPLSRAVGVELLASDLGEAGRRSLDALIGEPRVGAVVAARLGRDDRLPSADEIAWVLVDMASTLLEFGGETDEVIESVAKGMEPEDQASTIAILAFGDHPWTERVLRVFIDHHPDERVSAAARKALRRLHGLADVRG